jgi:hypothetical protein
LAHRCRQRAYRQREGQASVTHQAPVALIPTHATPQSRLSRCEICGRESLWNNPFDRLPRLKPRPSRRRRRRDARIYTFLQDR